MASRAPSLEPRRSAAYYSRAPLLPFALLCGMILARLRRHAPAMPVPDDSTMTPTVPALARTAFGPTAHAPRLGDDDRKRRSDQAPPGAPGSAVITKTKPQTKRPSMYRVLLLNDDYTPMEFVVLVLERFFNKDRETATRIMLHVHHHGIGECGIFTYEVAETKVTQVMDFARKHQHPLQCVMEKK